MQAWFFAGTGLFTSVGVATLIMSITMGVKTDIWKVALVLAFICAVGVLLTMLLGGTRQPATAAPAPARVSTPATPRDFTVPQWIKDVAWFLIGITLAGIGTMIVYSAKNFEGSDAFERVAFGLLFITAGIACILQQFGQLDSILDAWAKDWKNATLLAFCVIAGNYCLLRSYESGYVWKDDEWVGLTIIFLTIATLSALYALDLLKPAFLAVGSGIAAVFSGRKGKILAVYAWAAFAALAGVTTFWFRNILPEGGEYISTTLFVIAIVLAVVATASTMFHPINNKINP